MSAIEGLFRRTIPNELFHYTSISALEGILSSHCMWCTDSVKMNDMSELLDAQPRVEEAIRAYSLSSKTTRLRELLQNLSTHEYAAGFLAQHVSQYFLMCFSHLNDDLSQWCRYADDARGVCIGFDLRELRPPATFDTLVTFAPCVYKETDKSELLRNLISDFEARDLEIAAVVDDPRELANRWAEFQINNPSAILRNFKENLIQPLVLASVHKFRGDFIRLCCHFKNSSFEVEGEWRLVLPHLRKHAFKKTVVKEVGGRSHAEFPFEGYEQLPITSVRLGSGTDEERVRQVLKKANYNVEIRRSAIPYRPKSL